MFHGIHLRGLSVETKLKMEIELGVIKLPNSGTSRLVHWTKEWTTGDSNWNTTRHKMIRRIIQFVLEI